jgi:hypothetical protein
MVAMVVLEETTAEAEAALAATRRTARPVQVAAVRTMARGLTVPLGATAF